MPVADAPFITLTMSSELAERIRAALHEISSLDEDIHGSYCEALERARPAPACKTCCHQRALNEYGQCYECTAALQELAEVRMRRASLHIVRDDGLLVE